jgi:hypothetical protein
LNHNYNRELPLVLGGLTPQETNLGFAQTRSKFFHYLIDIKMNFKFMKAALCCLITLQLGDALQLYPS